MRAFVKNEFGETKYTKLCVRKFASSKEGIEYAKLCGVPKTERTFASIARIGNVEALGFALDSDWPHDVKAATACARGGRGEHTTVMPFPIPVFPPYAFRTLHIHGATAYGTPNSFGGLMIMI